MHRSTFCLAALAAGLLIGPNVASALPAVTTEPTNLRAGPAFDFPVVDAIPGDVSVNVHGCVRGYRWCDVSWRDARGWVPGAELAYLDSGRRVTIVEYGPRVRLPVVGFAFDTYWDRYYRGRSWYGERARWRTVWRDRDRDERRSSDRGRDRIEGKVERREGREGRVESRTERRAVERTDRDTTRRDIDRDRRTTRENRPNREDRPNVRTGRGDGLERGGSRALSPGGSRQDMDRGARRDASPGGGRSEPSMRGGGGGGDRGGMGRGGDGGGGGRGQGQGDRRP
jgi:uncharacterized protein YraI